MTQDHKRPQQDKGQPQDKPPLDTSKPPFGGDFDLHEEQETIKTLLMQLVKHLTGLGDGDPFKRQMVEQRLLGRNLTFWCLNYIYTGKVTGVYADQIELSEPKVVYETGDFKEPEWKDAQGLPDTIYVMRRNIESWGVLK